MVVGANSVVAADPIVEHADAPNVLLVLVMSSVKIHLPLLTETLALKLELEVVVVVGERSSMLLNRQ